MCERLRGLAAASSANCANCCSATTQTTTVHGRTSNLKTTSQRLPPANYLARSASARRPASVMRTRDQLIDMHGETRHKHIDEMMASIVQAEGLKAIV
jgi:hypothetical protein